MGCFTIFWISFNCVDDVGNFKWVVSKCFSSVLIWPQVINDKQVFFFSGCSLTVSKSRFSDLIMCFSSPKLNGQNSPTLLSLFATHHFCQSFARTYFGLLSFIYGKVTFGQQSSDQLLSMQSFSPAGRMCPVLVSDLLLPPSRIESRVTSCCSHRRSCSHDNQISCLPKPSVTD
ncbi:hypothetical protein CW304_12440 [Bacillus sp. UFRGS-B20]|nr:hypothetical protein CW304_12440 [Bacillus sp. UFRGS-B20]